MKDSDSNACRQETGLDKGITTTWNSELKVGGNEEVSTCQTTSTIGAEISESSSNPEGKGTPGKADKVQEAISSANYKIQSQAHNIATGILISLPCLFNEFILCFSLSSLQQLSCKISVMML